MTTKKIILGALESPVISGMICLIAIFYTWLLFVSFYGWVCKVADKIEKEDNLPQ